MFIEQDDESEIVSENVASIHSEPLQDGDGPPKVDSEVEVLQEKITKQIIKEGHGQKPTKYATCFCEYFVVTQVNWFNRCQNNNNNNSSN